MSRIADRKRELELLQQMLQGRSPFRVLLLEAPSERGKTVLLAEFAACVDELLGPGLCARLDFKGGLTLDELFSRLCHDLNAVGFATYTAQGPSCVVNVKADLKDAQFRDHNEVTVQPVIHTGALELTYVRGAALIEDLRTWSKPVMVILDTFESATEEAMHWVLQHLLPAVHTIRHLYVVIAGQRVPDARQHLLQWGHLARNHLLPTVTSIDDWYELASSRHPGFPRHYIETVCLGLLERPSAIETYIETVARNLPSPENPFSET